MTALAFTRTRVAHRLEFELDGFDAGWTDVSRDVAMSYGVQLNYGLPGNGPNDRVASAGTLKFVLLNSHANSQGLVGLYSRMHTNRRAGWELGIRVRWVLIHEGVPYVKHVGTLDSAEPSSGRLGSRIVECTSVDAMDDFARAKLTGVPIQLGKRADELLDVVLATMQHVPEKDFDQGIEVFPYALDSANDEVTTVSEEVSRIVASEPGYFFMRADGVARFENRHSRVSRPINKYVFDGLAATVHAPYSRRSAPNRIQVTVHPRAVDPDYSILFRLGDKPLVAPGETLTIQGPFTDETTAGARVGAVDVQAPIVAGLDYSMSLVATVAAGVPDTPFSVRPAVEGHYTGGLSGGPATYLADDSDATYLSPIALVWQTYVHSGVIGPSNAFVSAVELVLRIYHSAADPHFANWYPILRYGSIDLQPTILTTYAPGWQNLVWQFPNPPGGGDWTIAVVNATEIGATFNWDTEQPFIGELTLRGMRATVVPITDRTDDFDVVTVVSGNSATFTLTNNSTEGSYVTLLQIRGRIVTTYEPATVEEPNLADIAIRGENIERMNCPYLTSATIGATIAAYYAYLYPATAPINIDSISVRPNLDEGLMRATLELEVGDRIGIVESVTGAGVETGTGAGALGYHVTSVGLQFTLGGIVQADFGLAPADPQAYWIVEVEGYSEVEQTTVVGPM